MKKFFIIFIINIATIQLLSSQCDVRMYDIYTPKGTPVVTFLMCESSLQDRLALDSYFIQTYPQAIQLKTHKEGNDSIIEKNNSQRGISFTGVLSMAFSAEV